MYPVNDPDQTNWVYVYLYLLNKKCKHIEKFQKLLTDARFPIVRQLLCHLAPMSLIVTGHLEKLEELLDLPVETLQAVSNFFWTMPLVADFFRDRRKRKASAHPIVLATLLPHRHME